MSWSEIKKAVNSDLNKPLNELMGEILNNDSYGLSAIKNAIGSSSGSICELGKYSQSVSIKSDWKNTNNYSSIVSNSKDLIVIGGYESSGAGYDSTKWQRLESDKTAFENTTYSCPRMYMSEGVAFVHNDSFYIIATSSRNVLYQLNGNSWTQITTTPMYGDYCNAISYNGSIYLVGYYSSSSQYRIYEYSGSSWTNITTITINTNTPALCVYNSKLYIFGASSSNFYSFDGSTLTQITVSGSYPGSCPSFVHNGKIYSFNSSGNIYTYDGSTWTLVGSTGLSLQGSRQFVTMLNDKFYTMNGAILYRYNEVFNVWQAVSKQDSYYLKKGTAITYPDSEYVIVTGDCLSPITNGKSVTADSIVTITTHSNALFTISG